MAEQGAKPSVLPQVVGGRYKLTQRLGGGSFGDIYKGVVPGTSEEYAVKLEPANAKMPQLMYECKLYKYFSGGPGIPSVKWFGMEGGYNVMVMDLLGQSLENIMTDKRRKHLSLKSTIMLADQLLSRIEYFHSRDYIHRDIKPDNFLMGRDKKKNIVYVIDYGLSKRYRDSTTHEHIPYREDKGLTGTVRYASINSHLGVEQSRRDDLESIGYMFIYFQTGSLPWQGLKIDNRNQKFQAICDLKMNMPIDQLCKGCPQEFATYMKYVKNLPFEAKPDYYYMRRLFRTLFIRNGYVLDFMYDWTLDMLSSSSTSRITTIVEPPKVSVADEQSQQNTTKAVHEGGSESATELPPESTIQTHKVLAQQPPLPNYNILVGSSLPGKPLISLSVVPGTKLTEQQLTSISTLQRSMQIYHSQGKLIQNELLSLQESEFQGKKKQKVSNGPSQTKKREEDLLSQLSQTNITLQKLTQQLKVVGGNSLVITVNSTFSSETSIPQSQLDIQQRLVLIQQHLINLQLLASPKNKNNSTNVLNPEEQAAFKEYLLEEEKKLHQQLEEDYNDGLKNSGSYTIANE